MADPQIDVRQALNLPPEEMLRYLAAKDYRTTVNWAEMWHDDHVRSFTVAKVARYDLLETIRASMHDAWERGVPLDQWRDQLIPELRKAGWWGNVRDASLTGSDEGVFVGARRLENIFTTNFRMAAAASQWKTIQAAKELLPYLWYRTAGDERVRHSHRLLNDIILPVDHPFWLIYFPPNDWGCRCRVVQLSAREVARRGLKVTPDDKLPQIAPRLFWRPGAKTPEIVPGGVAPGFGYNPGVSYLRSFVPPPLEGPLQGPTQVARGLSGPLRPLPAPRKMPVDALLRDATDDEAIDIFLQRVGQDAEAVGDALVFRDMLDDPVVVSRDFFRRPDGSSKLRSDRRETMRLLAETLVSPDEIWWAWERVFITPDKTRWRWRLTRRYLARFEVDGESKPLLLVLQVGKDGWYGISAFVARNDAYLEKEQVRGGVLAWRRDEK